MFLQIAEIPKSIQNMMDSFVAFAMMTVAVIVIFRLWSKAQKEKEELLKENANLAGKIEILNKTVSDYGAAEMERERRYIDMHTRLMDRLNVNK